MPNIYQELLDKVAFFAENNEATKLKEKDLCLFISRELLASKPELAEAPIFLVYDGFDDSCEVCDFVLSDQVCQIVGKNDSLFLKLLNEVYNDVVANYLIQSCDSEGSLGYLEFKLSVGDPKQDNGSRLLIEPHTYGIVGIEHSILHRDSHYSYQVEEAYYGGLYLQLVHRATGLKMILHVSLLDYEVDYLAKTEDFAIAVVEHVFKQQPALNDFDLQKRYWQERKDFPVGSKWYLPINLSEINISLPVYDRAAVTLKLIKENED
jgi:hypothetical protein